MTVLSRGRSGQVLPGVLGHRSITIYISITVTTCIPKNTAQALPLAPMFRLQEYLEDLFQSDFMPQGISPQFFSLLRKDLS